MLQSRSKISSTPTLSHFFNSTLTPDSGKILFSTPTLTPTPRKTYSDSATLQQTKYKPIQECEDVNISVYCCSQTNASCYCFMQLDYSYVRTGRSLHFNQIFVQHWESSIYFSTLTPTRNSGKIFFSTLTPTPAKSFFRL